MSLDTAEARHQVSAARQAIIDLTGTEASDEQWGDAWERLDKAEHLYQNLTGQAPPDAFLLGDDARTRMGHRLASRYDTQQEGMRRRTSR